MDIQLAVIATEICIHHPTPSMINGSSGVELMTAAPEHFPAPSCAIQVYMAAIAATGEMCGATQIKYAPTRGRVCTITEALGTTR